MKKRVYFDSWGARGRVRVPDYAVLDPDDYYGKAGVVARAIARKSRLEVLRVQSQGTSMHRGEPESNHYQITLGRRAPGGGYSVEGSVWVAIPVEDSDA